MSRTASQLVAAPARQHEVLASAKTVDAKDGFEDMDATWSKDLAEGSVDRKNDPGGYVEDGCVTHDV